jgi:hypothetical protein
MIFMSLYDGAVVHDECAAPARIGELEVRPPAWTYFVVGCRACMAFGINTFAKSTRAFMMAPFALPGMTRGGAEV